MKAGPKDNIRWRRKINRPESWSTLHWGPHRARQDYSPSISVCGSSTSYLRFCEGVTCTKGLVMRREWRPRSTRRLATRLTPPASDHQAAWVVVVSMSSVRVIPRCSNCQTQARVPSESTE